MNRLVRRAPPLTAAALTGRSRDHLREVRAPGATLHRDVIAPFLAMRAAAAADGIDLALASSYRDFARQLAIWNGKFLGDRPMQDRAGLPLDTHALDPDARVAHILHWSALPGASRHHWGTDFDVIDRAALPGDYRVRLEPAEYSANGIFARLTSWLDAHMASFGFFRPYVSRRSGVQPEPWHLSYAPIAGAALERFTVGMLADALQDSEIEGREIVLDRIEELFARYVVDVDEPGRVARLSPRLS